jgi:hypothetical protein
LVFAAEAAVVWIVALLASTLLSLLFPSAGIVAAWLHLLVAAAACGATVIAWIRRVGALAPRSLPSRIEERLSGSAGLITTAATLSSRPEESRRLGLSGDLGRAVMESSATLLAAAPASLLFTRRDLTRRIVALAAAAAVVGAIAVADLPLIRRGAHALALPVGSFPSPVKGMRVVPREAIVIAGGALKVRAIVDGPDPSTADLVVRTPGVEPRRVAMRRLARGVFEVRLPDLRLASTYRAEAGGLVSDEGRVVIEPVPGVADLSVTVLPPAYTRLPETTGAGGTVEALRGSTVTVTARGVKPLASGELIFSDGTRHPLTVDGERVTVSFPARESGWYRLAVTDRGGHVSPPGLDYPMTILPDRAPLVLLSAPAGDLELEGAEPVVIAGRSTDDFGISSLAVRFRLPEGEDRTITLAVPKGGAREVEGSSTVDLTLLPLSPGDRVTLWMEARDNDTVAGPKVGSSRQIVVLIKDPALQRKALEEAEKRVAEELVNALADSLELGAKLSPEEEPRKDSPTDPGAFAESVQERMNRALTDLTAIADAAARSPNTPMNDLEELDALAEQVRGISERAGRMPKGAPPTPGSPAQQEAREGVEEITRSLEQAASLADQMPRRRNLRDAVEKGSDLMNAQNRLLDALQKMEDRPSAESDRAVADALAKIQDLLSQIGEILSKAPESLPEEFVNKDAMREFDAMSMARDLQEIASLARQGKGGEARAKAEELTKKLAKLLASLREGQEEMDRMGPEETAAEMEKQKDLLGEMIAEQRSILDETQAVQNRVTRDWPEEAKKRIEETLPELGRKADEFRQSLAQLRKKLEENPMLRASVGEVARNMDGRAGRLSQDLKNGRPVNLQETAEEIERGLGDLETLSGQESPSEPLERERQKVTKELKEAAKAGREFQKAMGKLPVDPKELATPEEKEKLAGLSRRQSSLQKQAAGLSAKMERLAALVPTLKRDAVEGMKQAAGEMGKATEALGRGDPLASTPPERSALSGLQKSKTGMEGSAARMRRMARMSGAKAGDGGGQNPGGMFPSLQIGMKPSTGKNEGGRSGVSTREFAIPKAEEFVPQPGLRESLQRTRGGSVPPAFREQVEEYYDRLSNR